MRAGTVFFHGLGDVIVDAGSGISIKFDNDKLSYLDIHLFSERSKDTVLLIDQLIHGLKKARTNLSERRS